MTIKTFDRGDYILEITTISPTERTKRMIPKDGSKPIVVPKPQTPPVARRIEPRRIGRKAAGDCGAEPCGPSLARKAVNYGKAIAQHVAAGRPMASDEVITTRFAICQSNECGLYKSVGEGAGECLHPSCGCRLKALGVRGASKLRWSDQSCPVGKWGAEKPSTDSPAQ